MLFTSSFKLLSVAAFLLPVLLVGASPLSLSERQGPGGITRHLKLNGYDSEGRMREFDEVILEPVQGEADTFIVVGDWLGTRARAKTTESSKVYADLVNEGLGSSNLLAYGQDGAVSVGRTTKYYIIYKDDKERDDSDDGSDVTEKGR